MKLLIYEKGLNFSPNKTHRVTSEEERESRGGHYSCSQSYCTVLNCVGDPSGHGLGVDVATILRGSPNLVTSLELYDSIHFDFLDGDR
jgi:hypothetical protein